MILIDENNEKFSIDDAQYKKHLERIKRLRLLDDDFFTVCLDGDKECTQFVLRILLDKSDLNVIEVKTQYSVKNLQGHSVILDAFATDSRGMKYDIEIQRSDKGASPKRARYNSSLIDDQILIAGDSYNEMNYPVLAQKTRYFKEETKGVTHMCKIMEEVKVEGFAEGVAEGEEKGRAENAIENAIRMLKDGLQVEKVSRYTELPVEKIEKLAALIAD